MLTPWIDLVLNSLTDLEKEVGDARLAFSRDGANYVEAVQSACVQAKADILIDLKNDLTDIFASRNGQFQQLYVYVREFGYTYNDLDTMFDKVYNPEVLGNAANAKTMEIGWVRGLHSLKASNGDLMAFAVNERDYWKKQYNERLLKAKRGLIIDLNEDGQIIDQERVRTRGNLVRV